LEGERDIATECRVSLEMGGKTMVTATAPTKLMTTEELEAMPNDGKKRWLIRGVLRERDMTRRNRFHSRVMMRIGAILLDWSDKQPEPRGDVVGGEAGFRLRRNPDSTAGIDVAYVSADTKAVQTIHTTLYEGAPVLAVEIISPSNPPGDVKEKVREYLSCGVNVVWVVDPEDHTVIIYRPGIAPEALDSRDQITAEPHLPGFSCPVADFFR
jgi:Uma2 family endonuclease